MASNIEYPSNSKKKTSQSAEDRQLEKVVSGTANVRKRSVGTKFAELFLGDEIGNVKSYLIFDMFIPSVKEMIIGGMEMLFFGSTRRSSRNSKSNPSKASYMVDYGSYSRGRKERPERRSAYPDDRIEMDDVDYETRGDAEAVLDALRDDIEHYHEATLAAFYQYSGVSNSDFTANDRGWTNLDMNIRPRRVRGGRYVLDLPRPQILG